MDGYYTVANAATAEYVEKRSRFISEIRPITDEADFHTFLAAKRSEHWDARHHCSAYILRKGNMQRYNEDGEPQGTAGLPILEVIRHEQLEDCAVIVTRYFGGTLLGTGGLVRAYTHSTKLAIANAVRIEICRCIDAVMHLPYTWYDRIGLLLQDQGGEVLHSDFAEMVTLQVRLRAAKADDFSALLTEYTGGSVVLADIQETFSPMQSSPT